MNKGDTIYDTKDKKKYFVYNANMMLLCTVPISSIDNKLDYLGAELRDRIAGGFSSYVDVIYNIKGLFGAYTKAELRPEDLLAHKSGYSYQDMLKQQEAFISCRMLLIEKAYKI